MKQIMKKRSFNGMEISLPDGVAAHAAGDKKRGESSPAENRRLTSDSLMVGGHNTQ